MCYRSVTEGANSSPYIADVLYAKKNLAMCAVAKVIGASVRYVNIRRACGATAGIRAGIGQAVDAITYSNTGDRLYARPIQTSVHGSPIVSNPAPMFYTNDRNSIRPKWPKRGCKGYRQRR